MRFSKLSEKILKKQAAKDKLSNSVCLKCGKITKNTTLVMNGKTFDELCEDMCDKFDIHSVNVLTPEIKKNMEKYLEEIQTKYCKPLYVCNSCAQKANN